MKNCILFYVLKLLLYSVTGCWNFLNEWFCLESAFLFMDFKEEFT